MLDNGQHSKANERFVLELRDEIIRRTLKEGMDVIVDDTNLHPKHEQRMKEIVLSVEDTKLVIKYFTDIPIEECIKRDLKRQNSVGEKVIRDMYNNFLKPKNEKYVPPEGKPPAIIVDIDGTLALNNSGRNPYDWGRVDKDDVNESIAEIVRNYNKLYKDAQFGVLIVSGRDSVCRGETMAWLDDNNIPWTELFMRPEGNTEEDSVIKKRIFDEHIRDNYQVLFVLDDRKKVVNMWRSLGLTTLQVADGDF